MYDHLPTKNVFEELGPKILFVFIELVSSWSYSCLWGLDLVSNGSNVKIFSAQR